MTTADRLRAEASKRILIKDGAYGTQVQRGACTKPTIAARSIFSKDQRGNNDLLNLTNPDLVRSICESFAEAGAEILATNTFNANAISQADYGAEALVARHQPRRRPDHARGRRPLCRGRTDRAGSPARSGRPTRPSPCRPTSTIPAYREVDFDQVKAVYREQVDALVDGGVDFILVETIFDTLNAKAAIMATLEAEQALGRELPLMISMTLTDLSGRNLSGHTVEAFWASVRHASPSRSGSIARSERRSFVRTFVAWRRWPIRW